MVERYWGAPRVQPGDFAGLVDRRRGGIPTTALVSRLAADGWQAFALRGSPAILRHHIDLGRPVIALLQVGSDRLHYVVVVGVTQTSVVYHDPALLPDQAEETAAFDRQWQRTDRWMLLVLPRAGADRRRPASPATAAGPAVVAHPPLPPRCADPLEDGVALARAREYDAARARFREAAARCGDRPQPFVELSSVDLLDRRYESAVRLAHEALAMDPSDDHAWRVLATAEFLLDRPLDALRAWNSAGSPRVDLINIHGLRRTRYGSVEQFLGLSPGELLTADRIGRAERRLAELPALGASRLSFDPAPGGYANLEAAVVERPLVPGSPVELAAVGARAVSEREARWTFASPTRNGEAITAAWRWWPAREGATIEARVPLAGRVRGVLGLAGGLINQSYAVADPGPLPAAERRRFARASLSDWATPHVRWELQAGLDRWTDGGAFGMLGSALDLRLAADRLDIGLGADAWPSRTGFGSVSLEGRWRSTVDRTRVVLGVDAGATSVSARAPRGLWPGAGTGHARPALLRAHPLLDEDGVIAGEAFGRQLVHGTVEARIPVARQLLTRLQAAVFVDAARAWQGIRTGRLLTDVGGGLRVELAGEGTIRVDAAHGLMDGADALSIAWEPPWPGRR